MGGFLGSSRKLVAHTRRPHAAGVAGAGHRSGACAAREACDLRYLVSESSDSNPALFSPLYLYLYLYPPPLLSSDFLSSLTPLLSDVRLLLPTQQSLRIQSLR
jgi:hypothetical protein